MKKEKKRILFDGFYGANGELRNEGKIILDILKKYYDVEISSTPDYIFCNVNSQEYYKYDGIRIFCTIEAICPDFNLCDYGIGFEYLNYGDRYLRYPNFYFYEEALKKMEERHLDIGEELLNRKFCSFVYSNDKAEKIRGQLFDKLSEYKKVDSGGKYLNNMSDGKMVENKLQFECQHKFSIACENASHRGYHTEKLVEAFAAKTVPIYWGDPEVDKVFNTKAFINCNEYDSVEQIVERVIYVDTHDEIYLEMLQEPALLNEKEVSLGVEKLEKYLLYIFEQPLEKAYRRNRGFWGQQYLQQIRTDRRVIDAYMKFRMNPLFRFLRWMKKLNVSK